MSSDQSALIDTLLATARKESEAYTWRALMDQTWELWLDDFQSVIEIDKTPVQSITSIKYLDADGVEQTYDSSNYEFETADFDTGPGKITITGNFPTLQADRGNRVYIRFVAGYQDAASVPAVFKTAIMMRVSTLWEVRQTIHTGTQVHANPEWFQHLLASERNVKFE